MLLAAPLSLHGQVLARWDWQGQSAFLDMIELQVDRGQGYGLLAMDTTPFPATAQEWIYKAICRVGDQRVGQWSDEVSERCHSVCWHPHHFSR